MPEFLSDWLSDKMIRDLAVAAVVFGVIYTALFIFKHYVLSQIHRLTRKTKVEFDDYLIVQLEDIGHIFYASVALFAATRGLPLPELAEILIKGLFLVAIVYETVRVLEGTISNAFIAGIKHDKEKKAPAAIRLMARIALWSIGFLLILSNLGFNVTSLIAGLGIGIAISLALQNVLGDIFNSFSIVLEKPFEEGDFIIIGNDMGTVEKIGLKSTRIKTLRGEELVMSNTELTTARIQNFRHLFTRRRVNFKVGVTYGTPVAKLKRAGELIQAAIKKTDKTDFEWALFEEMADFSLKFDVVYYVTDTDYKVYLETQQQINLGILSAFEKEGIEIAFPTQTVHMHQEKDAAVS